MNDLYIFALHRSDTDYTEYILMWFNTYQSSFETLDFDFGDNFGMSFLL